MKIEQSRIHGENAPQAKTDVDRKSEKVVWRLRRAGKSNHWLIEKLGNDMKWHDTSRVVTAKTEEEANRVATSWMLGGNRQAVEEGAPQAEQITAKSIGITETAKKTFGKTEAEAELRHGQKARESLNKPRGHKAAEDKRMAKKPSRKHPAERKSKTGVASYVKGHGCGRGKHQFRGFGHYAVCVKCGSRKTLSASKPRGGRGKGRKSGKGARARVEKQ